MKSRALDRRGVQVVEVPWPVQVYGHGDCRTAWPGSPCSCGQYQLHWQMKAAAWAGRGGEPMGLELVPDTRGILAMLEASIDGPYRFVHHALIPYVRIGPADPEVRMTIRSGRDVHLILREGAAKSLQGLDATMDLAVVFRGDGVELREVPYRAAVLNQLEWNQQARVAAPEEHVPRRRGLRTLGTGSAGSRRPARVVSMDESPRVASPAGQPSVVIPEAWREFCAGHDVHPELRDYVVIPEGDVMAHEPLEWWMVTHPAITEVQVVKPRLERGCAT